MARRTLRFETLLPLPAEAVFDWHTRPGAFERLTPPWEAVEVVQAGAVANGERTVFHLHPLPDLLPWLALPWVAEHHTVEAGRQFCDRQVKGPFAAWEHTHRFEAVIDPGMPTGIPKGCRLVDAIDYALPLGPLGEAVAGGWIREKLVRLFAYRHRMMVSDMAFHLKTTGGRPMKVLVSGAGGLVGRALVAFLTTGGHTVVPLVRRKARAGEVAWNPEDGTLDVAALEREAPDAVVHLAGENIAEGRWTAAKKARIRDSRVQGTRLLCEALAKLQNPPKVLVAASAIGYYGSRSGDELTETAEPGNDFLAGVCRTWEGATLPAYEKGIRVVNLRIGVVISAKGGMLKKVLPLFNLGGGGPLGSGRQFMSWIALEDLVGIIHHALVTESLRGPVNAVSPNPVTNAEFTRMMGKTLFRPAFAPAPAIALRLALGEMADALLLSSTRVKPARLLETGFNYQYPQLEGALRHTLGK